MSSRPFAPQDFGVIRIRNHRFRRHREPWRPIWAIAATTCVSMTLLCALVWWLTAGERESGMTRPTNVGQVESASAQRSPFPSRSRRLENPIANSVPTVGAMKQDQAKLIVGPSGRDQSPSPPPPSARTIYESTVPVHGHNAVDDQVFLQIISQGVAPAKLSSDEAFLRRVYLDTLGTLPTIYEAKSFLDDHREGKRDELIDRLLDRPEFADYWAMKWCDVLRVKAEFPINLWPGAAQAYHRWIHTAIKNNLPYDQFAEQLLTASGSNFRTPQVNFYRAIQDNDPDSIAAAVALTFLCERTEHWPESRRNGLAQFFSKVGYKPTSEWKEEIIFYDPRRDNAGANQPVNAVYPSGVAVRIPPGQDPRVVFSRWLTDKKNPWFARAVANRVWYWLLGRGIVEPADDVRLDNPPSNLPLLNTLAQELIASDYDLKRLYQLILKSSAYQLACIPQSDDPLAAQSFAYYPIRRHDAEVLIDAICQITGTTETYMSIIPEPYTFLPDHQRATLLPDGSITSSFLELFGRPARDTGLVSERNNRLTASQALHLLNSNHLRGKIERGPGIKALVQQGRNSREIADLIYLAILSRRPFQRELSTAAALCSDPSGANELAWALINTDEFLFKH